MKWNEAIRSQLNIIALNCRKWKKFYHFRVTSSLRTFARGNVIVRIRIESNWSAGAPSRTYTLSHIWWARIVKACPIQWIKGNCLVRQMLIFFFISFPLYSSRNNVFIQQSNRCVTSTLRKNRITLLLTQYTIVFLENDKSHSIFMCEIVWKKRKEIIFRASAY